MTNDELLQSVLNACATFSAGALSSLRPDLAARVATGCAHYVAVRCSPPRVRLVVEAPGGELGVVYSAEGPAFPHALGAAVAKLLEAALKQLPAKSLALFAARPEMLETLGVLVSRDESSATITLDDGTDEPRVLMRLEPAAGTLH